MAKGRGGLTKRRTKHRSEEIVAELRVAHAVLNARKGLAAVSQALEVGESTLERWQAQYGGMKCEEAKTLKHLEDEKYGLELLVADHSLDIKMLQHLSKEHLQALPESERRSSHFV